MWHQQVFVANDFNCWLNCKQEQKKFLVKVPGGDLNKSVVYISRLSWNTVVLHGLLLYSMIIHDICIYRDGTGK